MSRWRLYSALMVFGILQAVTNLLFMYMATQEKSIELLVAVIAMENLAGGMGTAAFLAFVMALCHHNYTATQFALLTALASLGRVFVGPVAGGLAASSGWVVFFLVTTLAALPGLLLLWFLRSSILELDRNGNT
jgi:PAT family beta-lactamase induction signal transducer AmpG